MKALTLWQPYASLIAIEAKPFETRDWAPPPALIGKRIAIHAAKRKIRATDFPDQKTADSIHDAFGRCSWNHWLPLGVVVCTAVLRGAYQAGPTAYHLLPPLATIRRSVTGSPPLDGVPVDDFGDYTEERWLWHLTDVQEVDPPVPASGFQKFWEWRPDPAVFSPASDPPAPGEAA